MSSVFVCVIVAALALIQTAALRGAVITMVDNGPARNRVDAVFLGDGYTASQVNTTYVTHIDAMLDHMFRDNEEPFVRYERFFNVHRINVVSNQSGADVPPEGIFRDTALGASYYFDGSTERLLYINDAAANSVLRTNLQSTGIGADMKLVTVNSSRYGGGGGNYAVYAGGNGSAPEVALHELGHSFAGLADEYSDGRGTYAGPEPGEPNVTTSATGAKWSHWLGYNERGMGTIGAYEGARYYDFGMYRPSLNSKMRSLDRPFDAVSREEIILDIYDFVDPLDAWMSNAGTVSNPASLWVDVVDPNVIDVSWLVNGDPVDGAVGETFDPREFGFHFGDFTITARAEDLTPWVRIERQNLRQSITWQVHLDPLPQVPGDTNNDGAVDLEDLNNVRNHFGELGDPVAGDAFPFDGQVNLNDLNLVRNNFGGGQFVAVPEPSTAALLVCAMAGMGWACRAQRKSESGIK